MVRKVLEGRTKGYTKHPQVTRFKDLDYPAHFINEYLRHIFQESLVRGYSFDQTKIYRSRTGVERVQVASRQFEYEIEHLKGKLMKRDPRFFKKLNEVTRPDPHPMIKIVAGEIEKWERQKGRST